MTTVPWATKYWDTHGFVASNGTITAPAQGKYRISFTLYSASAAFTTSQAMQAQIVQAGSTSVTKYTPQIYGNGVSQALSVGGSMVFDCNAGDTLTLQALISGGSTLNTAAGVNHIEVERIK